MSIDHRTIVRRVLVVIGFLVLIPVFTLGALAVSARFSDGPSVVFSGGPLVAGELVTGPEPDWSFGGDHDSSVGGWGIYRAGNRPTGNGTRSHFLNQTRSSS